MRMSIFGTAINFCIGIFLLIVIPVYGISCADWTRTQHQVLSEARNLVDEVIDSRELSASRLADFNLALAAQSVTFKSTIIREVKIVNPDPANPGRTYTTYLVTEDVNHYQQGDLITVKIEQIAPSNLEIISQRLLGIYPKSDDIILTGRVR